MPGGGSPVGASIARVLTPDSTAGGKKLKRQATCAAWKSAEKTVATNGPKSLNMALTELAKRGLVQVDRSAKPRHWLVIDPRESSLSTVFDLSTAFALLWTVIVSPFEVSFLPPVQRVDFLFVINRLVDLIFVSDMILQFFLMYPTNAATLEGAKWEDDRLKIAKAYLSSWFALDFVSSAVSAFDFIAVGQGSYDGGVSQIANISKFKMLRFVRLFRLVKIARLLRASRILKRWETRVAINYGVLQIAKVGFLTIALAHWSACMWSLQTVLLSDLKDTWVSSYDYCVTFDGRLPNTTYVNAPSGVPGWVCLEPGYIYSASIYWATMTITSIGYGDIAATHGNAIEQWVATVLMFTNSVMWGRVIATFCEVLSTMNPALTDFRITMDNLNRFVKMHDLPKNLRQRLRDYFHRTQHLQRTSAYRSVLLRMSPTLQLELLWHANRKWLRQVVWLQQAEPGFIAQLVLALKPMVFAPSEIASGTMLSIIFRGAAVYGGKILRSGNVWGEDMLLCSEKLRSKLCAKALTYLEVYIITRAELLMLASNFEDTYRRIRKHIMFIALRRGIIIIAAKCRARSEALRRLKHTAADAIPEAVNRITHAHLATSTRSANQAEIEHPGAGVGPGGADVLPRVPGVDNAPLEWGVAALVHEPEQYRLMMKEISPELKDNATTGQVSRILQGKGAARLKAKSTRLLRAPSGRGGARDGELQPDGGGGGQRGGSCDGQLKLNACYKAGRIERSCREIDAFLAGSASSEVGISNAVADAIAGGSSLEASHSNPMSASVRACGMAQDACAERFVGTECISCPSSALGGSQAKLADTSCSATSPATASAGGAAGSLLRRGRKKANVCGRSPNAQAASRSDSLIQQIAAFKETLHGEVQTLSRDMVAGQEKQADALAALTRELADGLATMRSQLAVLQQPGAGPPRPQPASQTPSTILVDQEQNRQLDA